MNIKPLDDRVVIKRIGADKQTPAGIILLDNPKEAFEKGTIMSVGRGRYTVKGNLIPMEVKPGDLVYYNKLRGVEINLGTEHYLIIKEIDLLCTL